MDRPVARRVLAAGLALGVSAETLFNGPALGINVPLSVTALFVAAWLLRRSGTAPDPADAWLPVAAIVCAAFVALTGDRFLALVDTAAALGFAGASVAAASGVAVTRRSAEVIALLAVLALEGVLAGAARVMRAARPAGGVPRRLPAQALPVMRGLAIGVPVALLFAVLFASADPIFRRGMDDLLGFQLDLGDVPGRIVFAFACAWLAIGLLSVAATGLPAAAAGSLGAAAGWQTAGESRLPRLGGPEALIVLGLVDVVSGAFVALQVAYLFGGVDTLAAAGMTYSDYARRGFFELVAAACLAGGLLVALEIAIVVRTRAYLAAALVLVVLTVVVLASAWLRLDLYQLAYGWTELRFYVAASIVTLAVALGLGAALMALDRMRWLGHGLVAVGLVSLVGLNSMAPAAFVADRNIQRVLHPERVPADGWVGLDTGYLGALGDDAIPVLVEAVPLLPEPYRGEVLAQLHGRALELAEPAWTSPAAWNAARDRARAALADLP